MGLFVMKKYPHPHAFINILDICAKVKQTLSVLLMPVSYVFGIDPTGCLAQ